MTLPVDPSRYLAFLGVMAAMAFFPGPANLFSVALGVARGRRAVIAAVVGMNLATLVWYVGAALGLGALVAAAPWAFRLLRLFGAAYLAWMAVGSLRDGLSGRSEIGRAPAGRGSALSQGFTIQIANPKILVFFTAVTPAFTDLSRPIVPQLVLFAPATIGMDVAAMTLFGFGGAAFARRMQDPRFRRAFALVSAALLACAAALVAVSAFKEGVTASPFKSRSAQLAFDRTGNRREPGGVLFVERTTGDGGIHLGAFKLPEPLGAA